MDAAERSLRRLGHMNARFRRFFGERDRAVVELAAKSLNDWRPDLVLSFMTNADLAVLAATESRGTPVVCWSMNHADAGLVSSMRRPGGRITGVAFPPVLAAMQLSVLRALTPGAERVAVLHNPTYAPAPASLARLRGTAQLFGLEAIPYEAMTLDAVRIALASCLGEGCGGLIVGPHELFNQNGAAIGMMAQEFKVPVIAMDNIVERGGVYSFMPDFNRIWQEAAVIGDRILRGENPGEIPVDRHIMPRTTLNLGAARTIGIEPPPMLIDESDRVLD